MVFLKKPIFHTIKMRFIYLLFYLFTMSFGATAQPKIGENLANHSLNEMREKLNVLSKKDSVTYHNWLTAYIKKAKATQSTDDLFNGYKHAVFTTDDPKVMHLFTDSLTQQALKTNKTLNLIDTYEIRSTIFYIEKNYQQSLAYELKALQLIDQKKHAYEYHRSLYAIGQTYFYLQQYEEALTYFKKARIFFESENDYRYIQGFMNSIRYEALTNTYLKNYSYSNELVIKGFSKLSKIKPDEQSFEKAYINYVYALNLHFLKNYPKSIDLFKDALPEIVNNDDYANESIAYYYIGLNYWNLDKKDEAVAYFNKIDTVFIEKNYANLETKDAYSYLIAYHKQQNDEEKQLYYTNKLLKVTMFLQNEYRYLSTTLHKQLDIKHLEREKARLEYSLQTKNKWFSAAVVGGSLILIGFAVALVMNYRKKKEYSKKYNELIALRKNAKTDEKALKTEIPETENTALNEPFLTEQPITKPLETDKAEAADEMVSEKRERSVIAGASDKVWIEIMHHLELFEKNKDFLNPEVNLNQLAISCKTNRSYLSNFINQNKGKTFTDYVNQLRIDYFMTQLETDPQWINYKINHISKLLGFPSNRSFSNAFLKNTGMSPSFYITQVKDEAQA